MSTAAVTTSFTNGTTADADQVNTNFQDLVTFLNNSVVHRDGSKSMSGALAMGTNKITGLANGTAATDAAAFGQVQLADTGIFVFSQAGELETGTGAFRLYLPYDITITEVEAAVGVAPTDATLIFDVNVNGTTIFTTQSNRPQITTGTFVDSTTTIEDADHDDGQYLTVDIDQIGSTLPGENAVVTIRFVRR